MEAEAATDLALPPEMLERVFSCLHLQDLKASLQVCRRWREVGEAPGLWARVCLRASRESMVGLQEALPGRRMLLVRELRLGGEGPVSEGLLELVVRHGGLTSLSLQGSDLSSVEPWLLEGLVKGLQELQLEGTQLAGGQQQGIFQSVVLGTKLKKLRVTSSDLSSVEPSLLAQAASRLEEVGLASAGLTCHQIEAILRALNSEARLARLDLSGNTQLWEVAPSLLASALEQLEHLDLSRALFLQPQIDAIFTAFGIQTKTTTMKIGFNNGLIHGVPANEYIIPGRTLKDIARVLGNFCQMVEQAERGRSLPDHNLVILGNAVRFGLFDLKIENSKLQMVISNNSHLQSNPTLKCSFCGDIFIYDAVLNVHEWKHKLFDVSQTEQHSQETGPRGNSWRPAACRNGDYCRFHSQHRCKFYHARPPQRQPQGHHPQGSSYWGTRRDNYTA